MITLRGAHVLWAFLLMAFLTGASNAREPGRTRAAAGARAGRSLEEGDRAAVDRLSGVDDRRPRDRRSAVRAARGSSTSSPSGCSRSRPFARSCSRPARRRASASRRGSEPPGWHPIHPRHPVLLGAITLDLFAVLFGGAIALLPLYAKSILHTGPLGLGVLRSMPAVGALAGAVAPHAPSARRARRRELLLVVALFGVSTIVFGLSRSLCALCARARVRRVRRHVLDEHPLDDRRARDPERAPRPRQLGGGGLHQRLERARRLRIGCRSRAARRDDRGRRRRRRDDRARARLAEGVPAGRPNRPAGGSRPGMREALAVD